MFTKMLTYKEVSEMLKIPVGTLRIWVMQKRLIPIKFGSLVRFSESHVKELVEKGIK